MIPSNRNITVIKVKHLCDLDNDAFNQEFNELLNTVTDSSSARLLIKAMVRQGVESCDKRFLNILNFQSQLSKYLSSSVDIFTYKQAELNQIKNEMIFADVNKDAAEYKFILEMKSDVEKDEKALPEAESRKHSARTYTFAGWLMSPSKVNNVDSDQQPMQQHLPQNVHRG